jgi:hypothetical protein
MRASEHNGSWNLYRSDITDEKEAIILDTRFNGGGWLDEALTSLLTGEVFAHTESRGKYIGSEPTHRWTRPSIVVMNEGNYSDAHCFPSAYTTLGIGETVGTQVPCFSCFVHASVVSHVYCKVQRVVKQLTARRALPVMARPCQEAQHSGRLLHGPPEGSYPGVPIRRCSPCKGQAIPCGLRLVLEHQGSSEPYNIRVTVH